MLPVVLLAIAVIALIGFVMGRARGVAVSGGRLGALHSRPGYHGLFCLLWIVIAGYGAFLLSDGILLGVVNGAMWSEVSAAFPDLEELQQRLIIRDATAIARDLTASTTDDFRVQLSETFASMDAMRVYAVSAISLIAAGAAFYLCYQQLDAPFRARNRSERILRGILIAAAGVAVVTTVLIVLSLVGESLYFMTQIDGHVDRFLFGTQWSPLSGVQAGKLDPDKVGAIPLFVGTALVTLIAMLVAVPIGLFAAIYLSDFASARTRSWAKPLLEILAGIPTVVYGFFAAITVAPALRGAGESIGLTVASESALAAGIVMGIMIIPFISSLSDDVINAVPQSLRDGSYGLGATKAETITKVVLPAALPGIVSAVLLGISRAVGETMIVVMAAGQSANLTWNPLEAVTTVTVQIVMLLVGDADASTAGGPAFALGFTLFLVTLGLNVIALRIVRRYREMYD